MAKDLGKEDWLKAARLALLEGGVGAVRIEKLARDLRVTKGSFYWHFKDREQLLEALLREWEEEKSLLADVANEDDMGDALTKFFKELERRCIVSEKGEWSSDAAIFAWAAVSPEVAQRANKEERARIQMLKSVCYQDAAAEYVYMAYLGFLMRRRRLPEAAKTYPIFAQISKELLLNGPRTQKLKPKKMHREKSL